MTIPPYRRHLDVAGSVADEIDIAARQLAADGHPSGIDGDPGSLESSGRQVMAFEETFQNRARRGSVFADEADNTLGGRVRNEPVEVRRVIGDEPDAHRVGRHALGQIHDGLHQGDRARLGPTRRLRHPADGAVRTHHGAKLGVLGAPALSALHHHRQGMVGLLERKEFLSELDSRTGPYRRGSQLLDQACCAQSRGRAGGAQFSPHGRR